MIKGRTKRVVVVRSPDPKLFEEAIFIVREDAAGQSVTSAGELLAEAQRIASGYVKSKGRTRGGRAAPLVYAAAGSALTGLVWALTALL